jgi:hypothetical protein
MAEIMLLLVFCLLIAMATVLSLEESKRVEAEELLRVEQATNKADEDLVAAIKQNSWVLASLRSAIRSPNSGAIDEFWRELVDSSNTIAEFKKDGVSPQALHERVAAIDKLKGLGVDLIAALHDPEVVGSIRKIISTAANPSALPPAISSAVVPGRDGDGPSGHQWPPITTLSEANGHYFKSGSAELSPEFRQELIESTPERIADLIRQYGVVLLKSKTLAGYKLIPLSGAQLVNNDETLAISGTPGDIRERRRIEIRLRKSEHHESSLAAPSFPIPSPKRQLARPRVVPPIAPRAAAPPVSPGGPAHPPMVAGILKRAPARQRNIEVD